MDILSTNNLKKIYGSGENEVHALDGVSLSKKANLSLWLAHQEAESQRCYICLAD